MDFLLDCNYSLNLCFANSFNSLIVPFQKNRKISPSRAARKCKFPKVKVTHNTSVFNFTNDSKDDYIQSCWDEVSRKKE